MRTLLICGVLVALALTAYAGVPGDVATVGAIVTHKYFKAPYDQVWDATINASMDMGLQIGTLDQDNGLISCPNTPVDIKEFKNVVTATAWSSDYKNCYYQATVLIKPITPDITSVKIMLKFNASEEKAEGLLWRMTAKKPDYRSNGVTETRFFDYLAKYLPPDLETAAPGATGPPATAEGE